MTRTTYGLCVCVCKFLNNVKCIPNGSYIFLVSVVVGSYDLILMHHRCTTDARRYARGPIHLPHQTVQGWMPPMSLIDRVRKSTTKQVATPSLACVDAGLVPFDMTRDLIQVNPVVVYLGADVRAVHQALVSLHVFVMAATSTRNTRNTSGVPASSSTSAEETDDDPHACLHTDVRIDTHEAISVCVCCGMVRRYGLNIEPEYDIGKQQQVVRDGGDSHRERADLRHNMEHWNQFVHLSEDKLTQVVERTWEWACHSSTRHSPEVTIAAGLLHGLLKDQLVAIGHKARELQGFDKHYAKPQTVMVTDPVPQAQFACLVCARRWHDRKSSRTCCRRLS